MLNGSDSRFEVNSLIKQILSRADEVRNLITYFEFLSDSRELSRFSFSDQRNHLLPQYAVLVNALNNLQHETGDLLRAQLALPSAIPDVLFSRDGDRAFEATFAQLTPENVRLRDLPTLLRTKLPVELESERSEYITEAYDFSGASSSKDIDERDSRVEFSVESINNATSGAYAFFQECVGNLETTGKKTTNAPSDLVPSIEKAFSEREISIKEKAEMRKELARILSVKNHGEGISIPPKPRPPSAKGGIKEAKKPEVKIHEGSTRTSENQLRRSPVHIKRDPQDAQRPRSQGNLSTKEFTNAKDAVELGAIHAKGQQPQGNLVRNIIDNGRAPLGFGPPVPQQPHQQITKAGGAEYFGATADDFAHFLRGQRQNQTFQNPQQYPADLQYQQYVAPAMQTQLMQNMPPVYHHNGSGRSYSGFSERMIGQGMRQQVRGVPNQVDYRGDGQRDQISSMAIPGYYPGVLPTHQYSSHAIQQLQGFSAIPPQQINQQYQQYMSSGGNGIRQDYYGSYPMSQPQVRQPLQNPNSRGDISQMYRENEQYEFARRQPPNTGTR